MLKLPATMPTRVTRGAAAKEASSLAATLKGHASNPAQTRQKSEPAKKVLSKTELLEEDKTGAKTQRDLPPAPTTVAKKRKRVTPKVEEDPNELPHNLGNVDAPAATDVNRVKGEDESPLPKRRGIKKASEKGHKVDDAAQIIKSNTTKVAAKSPRKKSTKSKDNPYRLTPGVTPYPDWPHPTAEECYEVNDVLSKLHGKQGMPPSIPPPSLTITGCGEVPSILDALIRTLLSGNTSGRNSAAAMKGLVAKFGILQEGIGKGSLNYNAIRDATLDEVVDAIKEGGMQNRKGKYIKMLLDIVNDENQARRDALLTVKSGLESSVPKGAENETPKQQDAEISQAEENILSLQHIHSMEKDDAITTMTKYPQIGVKTAACVVLFCMRKPCFAVDTHVFRLSKWLGWIPPDVGADPITTFRHLEVMIPDELKYSLHQLLIKHGKQCPRCRAITGPNSGGWDDGCVIDHFVKRTGPMKEGLPRTKSGKGKKGRKADGSEDDELDEEDDLDSESDVSYSGKKGKENADAGKGVKTEKKASPIKRAKGQKTTTPTLDKEPNEIEDAAMEAVATDIAKNLPKPNAHASASKTSKGKTKSGPKSARNSTSNQEQAKTPKSANGRGRKQ